MARVVMQAVVSVAIGPSPLPVVFSRGPDCCATAPGRPATRGVRPAPGGGRVFLHLMLAREHRAGQHRVRRTRRQLAH
jgi:hypothetical protein